MTKKYDNSTLSRRNLLKTTGAAGAAGLAGMAGCLSSLTGGDEESAPLEVLHGWTGGDGKTAVENLIKGFKEQHSEMETDFSPIGGGGNTNLDTLVTKRVSDGEEPSSWADWPGANLTQFTENDKLGDIEESVWSENGMKDGYVQEAKELSQVGGSYVAVPLGSHRLNNLFYNISVVEEAGVSPEDISSPSDLLDAMEKVKQNTDAVPMAQAMKAPWTMLQLWAVIMLGQEGFQAYMDFIEGNGSEDAVRAAFETAKEYSEYFPSDAPTIDLTESNGRIMSGDAAFIHQGNWVAGAYRNQEDFEYNSDWGYVPFPGTEDMYTLHIDAFVKPKNDPTPEKTNKFLRYVGSKDAQVRFNQYKGSIPPRDDVSTDEFGEYLTETMEDFKQVSQKPPTLAHGLAVDPTAWSDLKGVITEEFSGPYNVDGATQKFLDAV